MHSPLHVTLQISARLRSGLWLGQSKTLIFWFSLSCVNWDGLTVKKNVVKKSYSLQADARNVLHLGQLMFVTTHDSLYFDYSFGSG